MTQVRDNNTEISVKATFTPAGGPPDHLRDVEEETTRAGGLELSASCNMLGHYLKDDFFVLGPRLDLSATAMTGRRYRADLPLPITTASELQQIEDNPHYLKTHEAEIGQSAIRGGIVFGVGGSPIGSDDDFALGQRVFVTVGPEGTEGYRITGSNGSVDKQEGETILGVKGGYEMLLTFPVRNPGSGTPNDVGFIVGIAGLRTFNPVTEEAKAAIQLSLGAVIRF